MRTATIAHIVPAMAVSAHGSDRAPITGFGPLAQRFAQPDHGLRTGFALYGPDKGRSLHLYLHGGYECPCRVCSHGDTCGTGHNVRYGVCECYTNWVHRTM